MCILYLLGTIFILLIVTLTGGWIIYNKQKHKTDGVTLRTSNNNHFELVASTESSSHGLFEKEEEREEEMWNPIING